MHANPNYARLDHRSAQIILNKLKEISRKFLRSTRILLSSFSLFFFFFFWFADFLTGGLTAACYRYAMLKATVVLWMRVSQFFFCNLRFVRWRNIFLYDWCLNWFELIRRINFEIKQNLSFYLSAQIFTIKFNASITRMKKVNFLELKNILSYIEVGISFLTGDSETFIVCFIVNFTDWL